MVLPRLSPRFRNSLFALAVALGIASCKDSADDRFNCATDPASLGLCIDLHPEAGQTIEEWACLDPDCDDPSIALEFENGCSSISYLTGLRVGEDHSCVVAWQELAGTEHIDLALLGFEGGLPHEIAGGQLLLDPSLGWTLGVSGPSQLRLGQFFELRLTSNHLPLTGRGQVLLHVAGQPQGLLIDRPVTASGASQSEPWTYLLRGRVGDDAGLVGGPHQIELALVDDVGRVGAVAMWPIEITYSLPVSCPQQAACQQRVCGADALCGESCGDCGPGEACTQDGFCEPVHPGACPAAADCTERICGVDPICGVSCGQACPAGQACSELGNCEPMVGGSSSTGTTTGDTTTGTGTTGDDTDADAGDQDSTGCYPDCHDRVCGLDPVCGWSCGECADGIACVDGKCDVCVPDCSGIECGLDRNCGLICDTCEMGKQCEDGICLETSHD